MSLKHTRSRSNDTLDSLVNLFARVSTFLGSAPLPHVLSRDSAKPDSAGDSKQTHSRGLTIRSAKSSFRKRQHSLDLLFDPEEVLDIRPMHMDADDVYEVDPDQEDSKREGPGGLIAERNLKSKSMSMSKPSFPPPYSIIDNSPPPKYTPKSPNEPLIPWQEGNPFYGASQEQVEDLRASCSLARFDVGGLEWWADVLAGY